MRVLQITNYITNDPPGGRAQLCAANTSILKELCGENLRIFQLNRDSSQSMRNTFSSIFGFIDGVRTESIRDCIGIIAAWQPDVVFVDGSNLGRLIRAIKREHPRTAIICHFHNIERKFFWGALLRRPSLRALGVLVANYFAEKDAAKYADEIICLNARDGAALKATYGRFADHLCPISVGARKADLVQSRSVLTATDFALFVGGTFYANLEAVRWYAKNVAPHVSIKLVVAGRGFEEYAKELSIPEKILVVGGVKDLSEIYSRSKFVVAPIFDGSGMKTKVAEALKHGKKVVGTPEAFCGYERHLPSIGWCVENAESFRQAMMEASKNCAPEADQCLLDIYDREYSTDAATRRLEKILVQIAARKY